MMRRLLRILARSILLAGMALAGSISAAAQSTGGTTPPSTGSAPTTAHDPNRVEGIPIVIMPTGFAFQNLHLPQGNYALLLFNRTGIPGIQVMLEQMPGTALTGAASQQLFASPMSASDARLVKPALLVPGTYRLSVAGQPKWVCAITVQ